MKKKQKISAEQRRIQGYRQAAIYYQKLGHEALLNSFNKWQRQKIERKRKFLVDRNLHIIS